MEPDFQGWATKAGIQCSDGKTIMPNAFQHQDQTTVPLVWQHGHKDPENILGHCDLESRDGSVWAKGYFNDNGRKRAGGLLEHKDINSLSIWANQLAMRASQVTHGLIREVSLVLAGANPGALIESVTIRHDGIEEELEDEAIIQMGIELELTHAVGGAGTAAPPAQAPPAAASSGSDKTVKEVYDSMNPEQQTVLHYFVGEAIQATHEEDMAGKGSAGGGGSADAGSGGAPAAKHGETDDAGDGDGKDDEMEIKHNVFENNGAPGAAVDNDKVLSHDAMVEIVDLAKVTGSLQKGISQYALTHGIDNIGVMFPEAVALDTTPEFLSRRMEWVQKVLGGAQKSPFSRVKTFHADITEDEARAKGYITGTLKKDEFFSVSRRTTTPQTVYKKQKLDRDDIVDITDFDVVAWLRAEMRMMLDEEVARAILMGDGRDISSDDKIQEGNIRPIATDHELYVTTVTVNLSDANSSIQEFIDKVISNRWLYKGTGLPSLFCSETIISRFLLLKDTVGRDLYDSIEAVASKLRVSEIIPVEAMEEDTDLIAIMVNMNDYRIGTDKGGEVNMFDQFDIDYNQEKYLLETRLSGALAKLKSAIVFRASGSTDSAVTPNAPTFDQSNGHLTIVATTHVTYADADGNALTVGGSPYTLPVGEEFTVTATPASGYYLADGAKAYWEFFRRA